MPKVAYSEEDRRRVREELLTTALKLMSTQGIQHTTVEQVYRSVGISRSFFYAFFPTKEDLIVEALYLQQPRLLEYARSRMEDPSISWREGVRQFLDTCCYGGRNGVAVLSVDEQQMLFQRLSEESFRTFRIRQRRLFEGILESFGIAPEPDRVDLFINLSLAVIVLSRRSPRPCRCLCPMPPGSPQPSRSAVLWTGWNPCGNSRENSAEKSRFSQKIQKNGVLLGHRFLLCVIFGGSSGSIKGPNS